jgi:hypothetical protein
LEGRTIFYVKIETPNDRESIDEITLERQGITYRVEGNWIVFTAGETTAVFEVLETAEILTNRTEEAEIIVTLAQNGSLQIKGNRQSCLPIQARIPSSVLCFHRHHHISIFDALLLIPRQIRVETLF